MLRRQIGMFGQHARRGGTRPLQQRAVFGQIGKAQQRGAGLAGAQEFARAANVQIAPGEALASGRAFSPV